MMKIECCGFNRERKERKGLAEGLAKGRAEACLIPGQPWKGGKSREI